MGSDLRYILDANVFIEAYKGYCAFDLCPGFWQSIEHYGTQGVLASIDRVRDELKEGSDLIQWKSETAKHLFLPTDTEDIIAAYREVIQWPQQQVRFTGAARAAFADDADAWVIACAKARGLTIITHEKPAPNSKNSVKIPDVCKAFNIMYRNTFDMLRDLHISYIWERPMDNK